MLKVVKRDGSILGDILRKAFDYAPLAPLDGVATSGWSRPATTSRSSARSRPRSCAPTSTASRSPTASPTASCTCGRASRAAAPTAATSIRVAVGRRSPTRSPTALEHARGAHRDQRHGAPAPRPGGRVTAGTASTGSAAPASATGITKPLTARQVVHAARLALIYAVLDGSVVIRREHVDAATAWCDYSIGSTEKAFVGRIAGQGRAPARGGARRRCPTASTAPRCTEGSRTTGRAASSPTARAELEQRHLHRGDCPSSADGGRASPRAGTSPYIG